MRDPPTSQAKFCSWQQQQVLVFLRPQSQDCSIFPSSFSPWSKKFKRLLQYLYCRGIFSSCRNVAQSSCSKCHHGDISTLHVRRTNKQMWEPPELLLLYLHCNLCSQLWSGSNGEEMSKKYSLNNHLSSVLTKHARALLPGHHSSTCQSSVPIFLSQAQSGASQMARMG